MRAAPAAWGWRGLSPADAAMLILATLAAIAGQLAMTEGFRHLSVATGGALQLLTPLAVTAGGVLRFGEGERHPRGPPPRILRR
ncbi:MAG: hypothetical protein ACKOTE_06600, partial [Opitutaceae bacterium]